MPEEDAKIFEEAYRLYDKWRSVMISTPEEWVKLNHDLEGLVTRYQESRLALRLAIGLFDTFDDLYKDGKQPAVPDYFGRSDL